MLHAPEIEMLHYVYRAKGAYRLPPKHMNIPATYAHIHSVPFVC